MVDPLTALSAGGSLLSGIGSVFGSGDDNAKAQRKLAKRQQFLAQQAFQPIDFSGLFGGFSFGGTGPGFGGTGGGVDASGNFIFDNVPQTDINQLSLNLDPATQALFSGLGGLSAQQLGMAGASGGVNPILAQAFQNLTGAQGQFGNPYHVPQNVIGAAYGGAGQAFGDMFNLAGDSMGLLGQAQGIFGGLPGTASEVAQNQLALLREQAAPFEERAFQGLQNNLFSTGRLGTTGGALQTEAFARGLGQADLQRQLQAGAEGRAAVQSQFGIGQGLTGIQDQLLRSATDRFTGLTGLGSQLGQQQFQNVGQVGQQNFNQALQILQNAGLPFAQSQQLTGGYLQNALAALGGQSAIQGDLLSALGQIGSLMQAQANTRLGGATSPLPASTNNTATALAQLSNALAPEGGAIPTLGKFFGIG